jgi:hypothetical protein
MWPLVSSSYIGNCHLVGEWAVVAAVRASDDRGVHMVEILRTIGNLHYMLAEVPVMAFAEAAERMLVVGSMTTAWKWLHTTFKLGRKTCMEINATLLLPAAA